MKNYLKNNRNDTVKKNSLSSTKNTFSYLYFMYWMLNKHKWTDREN